MIRTFKTEIRDGRVVIVYTRNNEALPTAIFPVGADGPLATLTRVIDRINADPHCIHDVSLTIESSELAEQADDAKPSVN